jgi:hypothetical protein
MNGIGLILLLFGFSVVSVFGQTLNNNGQVLDFQQPNVEHEKSASDVLIVQGQETAPPNPTEKEDVEQPTSPSEEAIDEPTKQIGVGEESTTQREKTRRILKVVNDYELAADETVTTLVIIAGNGELQGRVTGNVLIIGGDIELTPTSQVNGTLHVIGGRVDGDIKGVANLQISNDWQMVPAAVHFVMHPHIFWGISDQANFRLTFVKFGLFLVMYLLIVALFPKPINAVSELFGRRPIGSIIFGILALVMIPLFLAVLTLSIVGVPFMLLVLSLLIPLSIFGKAAIFLTLGSTLFSGRWKPLAVIFSYTLYFMATALPYIDWVTFLIVNTIGIGLCLLRGISMALLQASGRRHFSPPQ